MIEQQRVYRIKDRDSLLGFLREDLYWDLPEASIDDVSFEWTGLDLNLSEDVNKKLKDGLIRQLQPFATHQPWGIFVVEFVTREVSIITLRQILRCFVAKRRGARPDLPAWQCENLLFICLYGENGFTFAHFKGDNPYSSKLTTFSWHPGEPIRTVCEFNLPALVYDYAWTPATWVEEWQKAFDVEKVNKDFYSQIARFYYRLTGKEGQKRELVLPYVGDDSSNISIYEEFAVRLIGRTVFCWFLKHKESKNDVPLIPPEALSLAAARETTDFYHSTLEPLFFEVMNKRINKRKSLAIPRSEIIPFLNGGLFERHPSDFYADEPNYGLKIPDAWFIDFFGLLERYNFTITENSSIDVDVAVDPEMLGRIFENLLAEVVPETGETARKATGSYYTPRAIVDYIVEQSLKQYLLTKTELGEEKVNRLVDYGEDIEDFSPEEKLAAVTALREIKVIDPACGSGAFLIGVLHRMLAVLEKVDPRLELWRAQYLKSLDGIVRQTVEKNISRENWAYIRKLMIIRDSIYGVDIQPIAVEIAKLRCFLSLVVDEIVLDNEENRGIEPLPNLEFKFVAANTLIGLPPSVETQGAFGASEAIKKLKDLRESYLRSFGAEKAQIEKEFRATQRKLFEESLRWKSQNLALSKVAEQLTEWDPFSYESCSWFDPGWMFGIDTGFDIAIANPPYINVQGLGEFAAIYRRYYHAAYGSYDIYILFIEKSLDLLRETALLTFITSNKYLVADYGIRLRRHILENAKILRLVDLADCKKVFESCLVSPVITMLSKGKTDYYELPVMILKDDDLENIQNMRPHLTEIETFIESTSNTFDIYVEDESRQILRKICFESDKLESIADVRTGIMGFEYWDFEPYIVEGYRKNYIRIVTNSHIDRYVFLFGKKINLYKKDFYEPYLDISNSPINANTKKLFLSKKVIVRGVARKLSAQIDNQGYGALVAVHTIISKNEANYDHRYLLALINSKLFNWYHLTKYYTARIPKGSLRYPVSFLAGLPIKKPLSHLQAQAIISLVDQVLAITKGNDYHDSPAKHVKVKELEHQIDQTVYELYGLTPEEIAVVEGINN